MICVLQVISIWVVGSFIHSTSQYNHYEWNFIDSSMAAPSRVKLWDHFLYCCTAMILMELLVRPTLKGILGIPE